MGYPRLRKASRVRNFAAYTQFEFVAQNLLPKGKIMIKKLAPLFLLASSAFAQHVPPSVVSTLAQTHPAASPIQAASNTNAAAPKAGGGGGGGKSTALQVVDSAGVTLGLYAGAQVALLNYNNELMAVPLGPDYDANAKFVSGEFNWTDFNRVFTSTDCSGTPYFFIYNYGTRYVGYPVVVSGQQVIAVIDTTQVADVQYNSFFIASSSTCDVQSGTDRLAASQDTIVAAPLGTPPFRLK